MRHVHPLVLAALATSVALAVNVGGAAAGGSAGVTSSSDTGPGSFRAAVAQANADPSVEQIVFVGGLAPIQLQSTVVYTGEQSLRVVANGGVLDGSSLTGTSDAFRLETAGDLSVIGLTIRDAPGEGLEYQVPSDAIGTKQISLNGVRVLGGEPEARNLATQRGGHGILINDQAFPDVVGSNPPNPAGSDAALDVSVLNSEFDSNGFGALDRDGLRVNEGGVGDLTIVVRNTLATDNGADGIELDERGLGSAIFTVANSAVTGNGSFHELFPPANPADIDLDDGIDVDESNDGDVIGRISNSVASDNFEEGFDLNENNAGNFVVDMTNVQASRNLEEGVDFEEDDDFAGGGDLVTTLIGVTADENEGGDAGLKIREKGAGNLTADVRGAQASGNDGDGINVREDAAGNLVATIDHSTSNENGDDGAQFDERADGALEATASRGTSSSNDEFGVLADQGNGTLRLVSMTLEENGDGPYDNAAGVVVVVE